MANHFPVVPAMGLAELQYQVRIAAIGGVATTFPAGALNLITYSFETGIANGQMQFDYTVIDQDAHESQMVTMLNSLATVLAGNMQVAVGVIQSAMSVFRTWIFVPNDAANSDGYQAVDQMAYP